MTNLFYSYREASKGNLGRHLSADETLNRDDLKFGALLRIADATEIMAKNIAQLESDRDHYRDMYKHATASVLKLGRSNAALRGVIKRMKWEAA